MAPDLANDNSLTPQKPEKETATNSNETPPENQLKRFKCRHCDRRFRRGEHRTRHELSHSNERPYACIYCTARFVRRDLLLRHYRTVHDQSDEAAKMSAMGRRQPDGTIVMAQSRQQTHRGQQIPRKNTQSTHAQAAAAAAFLPHASPGTQASQTMLHWNLPTYACESKNPAFLKVPSLAKMAHTTPMQDFELTPQDYAAMQELFSNTIVSREAFQLQSQYQSVPSHAKSSAPPAPASCPLVVESENLKSFVQSLVLQVPNGNGQTVPRPTKIMLDRYLAMYFAFFHPLMPMIHMQTFSTNQLSSSLFAIICATGARLCHELDMAKVLAFNSRQHLPLIPNEGSPTVFLSAAGLDALSTTQSFILNISFIIWAGDTTELGFLGPLRRSAARLATALVHEETERPSPTHQDGSNKVTSWIYRQCTNRTYFCALLLFCSMSSIFDFGCPIDPETLPNIELPCSEAVWNGQVKDWNTTIQGEDVIIIQDLINLLDEQPSRPNVDTRRLTPFSIRVLAFMIFQRQIQQRGNVQVYNQIWRSVARDTNPGYGSNGLGRASLSLLLNVTQPIMAAHVEPFVDLSSLEAFVRTKQHPLIVISYVSMSFTLMRSVIDLKAVRENMQFFDPQSVADAALNCMSHINEDTLEAMLPVVVRCIDILRYPCLLGFSLMQVQMLQPHISSVLGQALVPAFELLLGVIIWIFKIEERVRYGQTLTSTQRQLLHCFQRMCADGSIMTVNHLVSPSFASIIGYLFDGLGQWTLANVMASSLHILSKSLTKIIMEMS